MSTCRFDQVRIPQCRSLMINVFSIWTAIAGQHVTLWPPCWFSSKQLHSHVNYISEKKIVLRTNMAALSLSCKPRICSVAEKEIQTITWSMNHYSFFRYNNARQWLNIDLGTISRVKRISTQGRYDADQWVTSYAVSYSVDNINFYPYKEKRRIKVRSIPLPLKNLNFFISKERQ